MKTPIESFVDKIFLINLARRRDRLQHAMYVLEQLAIDRASVTLFDAYDKPRDHAGTPNGNMGCTASHRAILEIISFNGYQRALVLEDDFDIAFTDPTQKHRVNAQGLFHQMTGEIPEDFEILYLGGHYAETPRKRVSPHIIRIGRMHTTSSYIITADFARKLAPHISGVGPIDTLYSGFLPEARAYCVDPRLFNQMEGYSDLMEKHYNPSHCMQDLNHIKAMDAGTTYG